MREKDRFLIEAGLGSLIGSPLYEEVCIIRGKAGAEEQLYGYNQGGAWCVMSGSIKLIVYLEDGKEVVKEVREGEWIGAADAILSTAVEFDAAAYSDAAILEVPMRKMVDSRHSTPEILRQVVDIMALTAKSLSGEALERIRYSDEMYFLKYLVRGGYSIRYKSLQGFAELLNINLRTLQRILKKLEVEGLIERERGRIEVGDPGKIDEYIEALGD